MKKTLLLTILTFCLFNAYSQGIFDANIHTATPFGDVNSPGGESSQQIIDQDSQTKFLDFNNIDGMGFEVDMLGVSSIVNSIEMVTANDAPERDPNAFELYGSIDGMVYDLIIADDLPCVDDRFLSRTFGFTNNTSYSYYRVNFSGQCATSEIMQLADVQLYPTIGNAPEINCAESMQVENTIGLCGAIVNYEVTASDIEDGNLSTTIVSGLESGSTFPIGTSSVIYSVTDSDNNVVSCGFTITVSDTEAPSSECSENISVGLANPDDTEAIVNYDLNINDNCSVINPLEGYTSLGTINGSSYYLSDAIYFPENSFLEAAIIDGQVGSILSDEDNQTILDWIKLHNNGVSNVLIGLNDIDYEGVYVWPDDSYADYTNWNENEPNNSGAGGGPENYTAMLTNGKWNDVDNTVERRFLLELDFVANQTEGLASGESFPIGTTTNTYILTDAAGNSSTCSFDVLVDPSVNTNELLANEIIQIAPNPATNEIRITNISDSEFDHISILDRQGRLIQAISYIENNTQIVIDISKYNSGLYFLKAQGSEGSIVKKIIIQ